MKKTIALLIALIMVLSFASCSKKLDLSEMYDLGKSLAGTWQIGSFTEHYLYFEPGMTGTKGYVCNWGEGITVNGYGNVKVADYEREGSFKVREDGKIIISYDDGDEKVIYFKDKNDKNTFTVEGGTDWVRIG